jgi:hypothetical protein
VVSRAVAVKHCRALSAARSSKKLMCSLRSSFVHGPSVLKSLHTAPHPDKDASDAMDRSGAGKMSGRPDKKSASESHQSRSLRASFDRVKDSLDLIRRPLAGSSRGSEDHENGLGQS